MARTPSRPASRTPTRRSQGSTAATRAPVPVPRARFGPLSDAGIRTVFRTLARSIVPKTELVHSTPFELLVAVVLSAHATDRSVNKATAQLFPRANTPAAIVALGEEGLRPYLAGINHYYTKARYVIALARQLLERHGGEVPEDREALEDLPGVGRKTASVVLNGAFRHPVIAVDTHIHRVANRLGIARTQTPAQTEEVLMARTPQRWLLDAHHYLILHGRYCCKARRPECWRCPVSRVCCFEPKSSPA